MLIISSLNKIAVIYQETGEYVKATEMQLQVLQLAEQLENDAYVGITLNALSRLLQRVQKYEEAMNYSRRALQIAAKNEDTLAMAAAYQSMEGIYESRQQIDSAYRVQAIAIHMMEQMDATIDLAKAYNDMGILLRQMRRDTEAIAHYMRAFKLADETGNASDAAFYAANAGNALMETGRINEGYQMLLRARANENNKPEVMRTIYAGLTIYYIRKGLQDSALAYSNLYRDYTDTLYSTASAQQINELYTKYETAQKEQQIELLAKQNTINQLTISRKNIIIAVVLVSFLAVVVMGIMFYNRRRAQQQATLQEEIARQQRLTSVAVLAAEEMERKRIASDLHDGIGQMFSAVKMNLSAIADRAGITEEQDRHLLDNTLALVDESCKEVRIISHQMMPNVLLRSGLSVAIRDFINKIDESQLKITLDAVGLNVPLDANTETVLYRIIQEAVNNVIKHAQATRLDIQLTKDADSLTVTIEDNGIGFDRNIVGNGIGLKNIEARAAFLNGKVEYDTAPGKGTLVAIYIPYHKA